MNKTVYKVLKARGTLTPYASSSFLLQVKGNPRRKVMKNQKCRNCLWNWPDLHGGEGRVCYNNTASNYHNRVSGKACGCFEYRVNEGKGRTLYDD